MSDQEVPGRPQAGEGESESVGAPFRDAEPPTRGKSPFVWVVAIIVVAVAVGILVAALGLGLAD